MSADAHTGYGGRGSPAGRPAEGNDNKVMPGADMPLNTFQQFMRQWTRLGPYTAGQAMCVRGRPDAEKMRLAALRLLAEIGLGIPEFGDHAVRFTPVDVLEVQVSDQNIEQIAALQMNRPFTPSDIPLRFFLINTPESSADPTGPRHWVLVMYDHWLADSGGMRMFMQSLAAYYLDCPSLAGASAGSPPRLPGQNIVWPPAGRSPLFGRCRTIAGGLKFYIRHRRAWRVNLADPLDFSVGLKLQSLPDGLINRLQTAARRHGGSVNDLFLAAIARAMGPLMQAGGTDFRGGLLGRRDRLSLGTIVDMRHLAGPQLADVFGLYLGFSTTQVNLADIRQTTALIQSITRQTRRYKSRSEAGLALRTLDVARFFWRMYDQPRHQALFFQKNTPVAAGVSNVNLTAQWMCPAQRPADFPILDYIRISPTGPLLPLVLTLTTVGPLPSTNSDISDSRLNLSFTWRKTAMNEPAAENLCRDFVRGLEDMAS